MAKLFRIVRTTVLPALAAVLFVLHATTVANADTWKDISVVTQSATSKIRTEAHAERTQFGREIERRRSEILQKIVMKGAVKSEKKVTARRQHGSEISKSLAEQQRNLGKRPSPIKPLAQAKPKKVCKRGGGLLGAMNCITERIEGVGGSDDKTPDSARSTDANAGTTTTSVKNSDGSRTVTKTDKDGNVLSKETVGKSPATASSTDKKTGITTKSVRNPDGTRTVTKTDMDGNLLSREKVGKSPDSASSTEMNTGKTITSVANPDGSRTVTKTDKDGNVLSREKGR